MFDLSTLLVGSIPLMVIVFGLVEFFKSLGFTGKVLTVISMILGILFGMAYQIAADGLPVGFPGWFAVVVFGLAIGLVASGFYDFANARWPKNDDLSVLGAKR